MPHGSVHVPTRRQHIIGASLAVIVALIWVLSAELVQSIFNDDAKGSGYEKPYFVSYTALSAFVIVLFGFVRKSWRAKWHMPPAMNILEPDYIRLQTMDTPSAPTTSSRGPFSLDETEPEDFVGIGGTQPDDSFELTQSVPVFNVQQVFSVALVLAPIFFLADWVFTIGLQMTTVASSSTISTLSAFFTLCVGACIGVERFSKTKLLASFATTAGVALISIYDNKEHGKFSLIGDMVNILSAFIYAIYTTFLKKRSGPPGTLDIAMLFAFTGLIILVGGLPGFAVLDALGWEKFEFPSKRKALMLAVNALIGTVLSEYLWAKSIVLTTPLIGTLALSLTVPLSVIIDYFFKATQFSWSYLFGVALVLSGFFMVNLDEMIARNTMNTEESRERDSIG